MIVCSRHHTERLMMLSLKSSDLEQTCLVSKFVYKAELNQNPCEKVNLKPSLRERRGQSLWKGQKAKTNKVNKQCTSKLQWGISRDKRFRIPSKHQQTSKQSNIQEKIRMHIKLIFHQLLFVAKWWEMAGKNSSDKTMHKNGSNQWRRCPVEIRVELRE